MHQRRKRDECWGLWNHSCLLRAATNLAADRHRQLDRTLDRLGLREIPEDSEEFTRLQAEAAREIGGIRTRMVLDAPEEIEKYHWGTAADPRSACLPRSSRSIRRSAETIRGFTTTDGIDAYHSRHAAFLDGLRDPRDSLLHQRYDNMPTQGEFVREFAGGGAQSDRRALAGGPFRVRGLREAPGPVAER